MELGFNVRICWKFPKDKNNFDLRITFNEAN